MHHFYTLLETRVFPKIFRYWGLAKDLRRLDWLWRPRLAARHWPEAWTAQRPQGCPHAGSPSSCFPVSFLLSRSPHTCSTEHLVQQHEVLLIQPLEKRPSAAGPRRSCKIPRRQELEAALQGVLHEKKAKKQEPPPGFDLCFLT